jgi:hypothetical protein
MNMVKVIKVGRFRWLGHVFKMQEQNPCSKLTTNKPEDTMSRQTCYLVA